MRNDSEPTAALDQDRMRRVFRPRNDARILAAGDIRNRLEGLFESFSPHPTIKVRTKDFDSYYRKCIRQLKSGMAEPLITDLIGIRIVCPFLDDLRKVEDLVRGSFDVTEVDRKGGLYSFKEFGYESIHLLVRIPEDITRVRGDTGCEVAEVQIRTTLQDAWAEVEHEIFYKSEFNPMGKMKRKLYAVNANLYIADAIFQEVRSYQKDIYGQLTQRREAFFRKVEETADAFIPSHEPRDGPAPLPAPPPAAAGFSVADAEHLDEDDLLLRALILHNEKRFAEAVAIFTHIIAEYNPGRPTLAVIYKHRGMANFARSKYDEAIADFTKAHEMDAKSYTSIYWRGIVRSVQEDYLRAVDDFSFSLTINPCQSFCLFRRGQAFFHLGDYPRAIADCDASLALDPSNDKVRRFREMAQGRI